MQKSLISRALNRLLIFFNFLERFGAAGKNPSGNYLPGWPHLPANLGGTLLAHESFGVLKLEIIDVLDVELLYLKA